MMKFLYQVVFMEVLLIINSLYSVNELHVVVTDKRLVFKLPIH